MPSQDFDLLNPDTPLVFADGTAVYKKLAEKYVTHDKGYYILAPSGAGKTHFINSQTAMNWMDGDELWMATSAHPAGEWWLSSLDDVQEIARRSDVITQQAKKLGFWIVGVDDFDITPDAVVIPHWSTHQRYIRARENGNYDGGATSANLKRVLRSRKWISRHIKNGVQKFNSVAQAAAYLAAKK